MITSQCKILIRLNDNELGSGYKISLYHILLHYLLFINNVWFKQYLWHTHYNEMIVLVRTIYLICRFKNIIMTVVLPQEWEKSKMEWYCHSDRFDYHICVFIVLISFYYDVNKENIDFSLYITHTSLIGKTFFFSFFNCEQSETMR